jgi:serine/threonine-protein kinase
MPEALGFRSVSVPDRLGRYEIVGALAHGGMAELFLARLPGVEGFAKRVVIKRVLPGLAREREFVEMFLAEARLAAALDHNNIVQVHDIGHDSGGYFFAMELLHGADVATVLRAALERDGALPLPIALEIVRGACAGLHYAHDRVGPTGAPLGLVHRDVSPQNLFVTFDGTTKLLDFGIAKAVEKIANHLTRSGTLRGKLPYMSPEQARGEPLDRRSDVFSLAIVLWEMTVGARLFGAENEGDFAVLKQIVETDAPPPSTRVAEYPAALEAIVMKGLQRHRDARYQSADELAAAIEGFVRERSLWATPRDVAAYMAGLFPDRAVAWKRADREEGGAIVPLRGRQTVELPADPGLSLGSSPNPNPNPSPNPIPNPNPNPIPTSSTVPAAARPRSRWLWPAALVAVAAIAVTAGYLVARRTPAARTTASPPATSPAPTTPTTPPVEDAHWFRADDYLISKDGYKDRRLEGIRVAKMLAPAPAPGAETTFIDTHGVELSTQSYWRTRPARPEDLRFGALVFCRAPLFGKRGQTPATREDSRDEQWTLARITDVSTLAAGRVLVGDVDCDVGATRVADPPL